MIQKIISNLDWRSDRLLLDGVTFLLQKHFQPRLDAPVGDDVFVLYKDKGLLDDYANVWPVNPSFQPKRIVELGIWAGGSIVLWDKLLTPDRLLAIDKTKPECTGGHAEKLSRYIRERGLTDRIKVYWETDQGDATRLRQLVARECAGSLDLVIDDASHMYDLTKHSFETLFPRVRAGGWYFIEDWSWSLNPEFHSPAHPWFRLPPLVPLMAEFLELLGSSPSVAKCIRATSRFVAVERGELPLGDDFRLDRYITRRPKPGAEYYLRQLKAPYEALRHRMGGDL
jgi:hypothetical protein